MKIEIENFAGIAPRIAARRLADNMAQIAHNCVFRGKELRALKEPLDFEVPINPSSKTIGIYQGDLLQFSEYVDYARSPVANDAFDRLYYTDSAYPKVRSGAAIYRLGIPRPSAAPGATPTDAPATDDEILNQETIYYVFTYVDDFGAEGPPSLPSSAVVRVLDTPVDLTFPATPAGDYNFGAGAKIRIYRSNTGTEDTAFQFVAEIAFAATVYTDSVPNAELAEVLPSSTWIGPPDDTWSTGPLKGLTDMGNGVFAGFSGRTLHFCEPYLPHAWPLDYRKTVQHDIVGVVYISTGLLVLTTSKPYLVVGTHPAAYTLSPIEGDAEYPCLSKNSIVDMGDYAIWVTNRGLAMGRGTNVSLITEEYFDESHWLSYKPESILGVAHLGAYIGFWNDTATGDNGSFIFDLSAGANAFSTTGVWTDAVYHNPYDDKAYIKYNGSGHQWDGGDRFAYCWRSKLFTLPYDTAFMWLEMVGDFTGLSVRIGYGDDETTFEIADRYTVIPAVAPRNEWWIEVTGIEPITYLALMEDIGEVDE